MSASLVHESLRNAPVTLPESERIIFASSFDGLLNTAAKSRVTPELRATLKGLGVELSALLPAYPREVFVKSVAACAAAWFPGEPVEDAWFKIGVGNLDGFYETFIGKPLFVLLRVMGPRRTLGRMRANFRSANNYTESKMVEIGPHELQVWVNETGELRHFIRGAMCRGLQLAGSPGVKFDELSSDERGAVFRVLL